MNKEHESQAQKYENSREFFRSKARHSLLSEYEKSNLLVSALNEIIARHMYYAEGRSWDQIENGEYFSKLILSFTRTHFILYDLIICNELIDAAVLFRKQLELVSRLLQLDVTQDASKLLNRTPHPGHLNEELKRLYDIYSKVAHSSNVESFSLLGSIDTDNGSYLSVFPNFHKNSYVSLLHLFLLVTEYHYWITDKYSKWFKDYNKKEDCKLYTKCREAFSEIYNENSKI